jgi:toxin FitB
MFLLDTVIISELRKKRPDAGVLRWISGQQDSQLFLSVVTLGEIERGIEKQRGVAPEFAEELATWVEHLTSLYADRILPITPNIARVWGRLSARIGNEGADLLIAATGLSHGLTVVTRNTSHFEPAGVSVINPFNKAKS